MSLDSSRTYSLTARQHSRNVGRTAPSMQGRQLSVKTSRPNKEQAPEVCSQPLFLCEQEVCMLRLQVKYSN